eukprot:TRINITY_DN70168_c0_g1_i1.p1 TRINITY_DN70168_c0_g1~~TRINITY_DN70168_c0_g1_i1.p1  ORF type:complete len:149 (+),score=31.65 TRINITY_DN70168_c0_g1_i1:112-558(+)
MSVFVCIAILLVLALHSQAARFDIRNSSAEAAEQHKQVSGGIGDVRVIRDDQPCRSSRPGEQGNASEICSMATEEEDWSDLVAAQVQAAEEEMRKLVVGAEEQPASVHAGIPRTLFGKALFSIAAFCFICRISTSLLVDTPTLMQTNT